MSKNNYDLTAENIKSTLEGTGVISNVKLHYRNYFGISFKVFKHADVRRVVEDCCHKIARDVSFKVENILPPEYEVSDGRYGWRVDVPVEFRRSKHEIVGKVLSEVNSGIERYVSEHEEELNSFKIKRGRRRGKWE